MYVANLISYLSDGTIRIDFSDINLTPVSSGQIIQSLILADAVLILMYLIRRIAVIYNLRFDNTRRYVGMALVHVCAYGNCIYLSKRIIDRGYTGTFLIKQGKYQLGRRFDREIIVYYPRGSTSVDDKHIIEIHIDG